MKSQSRIITQLPDQSIVKINRLFRGVADEHKTGLPRRSDMLQLTDEHKTGLPWWSDMLQLTDEHKTGLPWWSKNVAVNR